MNPSAICMYPNPDVATIPGTETKVTPDMAEPIMAKATIYHDCLRFPVKKPALSDFLPVNQEIVRSTAKYARIVIMMVAGVIEITLLFDYNSVTISVTMTVSLLARNLMSHPMKGIP